MRLAVIGVGLIGGSFALALKQAGKVAHVVGAGRSRANLELARERRIIDSIAPDAAAAARDANLVLVAAPVAQFARIFQEIGRSLAPGTVVTDAGSTKRDVVAAARAALGARIAQFVPGHPVAGAELSGAAAATAGLFLDRRVVLTPLPENRPESIERVEQAKFQPCSRVFPPGLNLVAGDEDDPAGRVQPQVVMLIPKQRVNFVAGQAVHGGHRARLAVTPTDQSEGGAPDDRAIRS